MQTAQAEKIKLKNLFIGDGEPVFIIAEAGINHNGELKLAEELIRQAKKSGANAIKFQTYITEKRVPSNSPIFGILKQCELSQKNQADLARLAAHEGILFFSTPFDLESADFLASLGVELMKIASFDIVNKSLLRQVASKKIPTIISRGMATADEIGEAVTIFDQKNTPIALLHCVSSYPNSDDNANLRVIQTLKEKYGRVTGYSDHTLGIRAAVLSVAAGAAVIEKHFTLDRKMAGPDHAMSCDPATLKQMVKEIRETECILGDNRIRMIDAEKGTSIFRRPSA